LPLKLRQIARYFCADSELIFIASVQKMSKFGLPTNPLISHDDYTHNGTTPCVPAAKAKHNDRGVDNLTPENRSDERPSYNDIMFDIASYKLVSMLVIVVAVAASTGGANSLRSV